jgi:predicted nucleic acid-binding protein
MYGLLATEFSRAICPTIAVGINSSTERSVRISAYRHDVIAGAYRTKWWSGAEAQAVEIADRYAGLGIGMADASLVALAGALETTTIATFDERHFRAIRPLWGGGAFTLLPLDAG